MSAGWTPGPWDWWDDGEGLVRITEAAEQKFVAQATLPSNARLIAAAPDMFEAIAEVLDTLIQLRADLIETDAARHAQRIAVIEIEIERLKSATRKAHGESPHNQSNPKVGV